MLSEPIEYYAWGTFQISGKTHSENGEGVGKDIRLIGADVSEWVERKGHLLTIDMVSGVFGKHIDVLIIGNGYHAALECPQEVVKEILHRGIPDVRIMTTPKACVEYNRLVTTGIHVALLAHGTC